MRSATTVIASSTVERVTAMVAAVTASEAAAMETFVAVKVAAPEAATVKLFPAMEIAASETFAVEAPVTIKSTSAIVSSATVVAAPAVEPMEPGTRADENAAIKIFRSVVSVRSAGVRGVVVISVRAGRRPNIGWPSIHGPNTHSNTPANLRVRTPRDHHEKPDQHCIS
jgi:hypothetical protein